MAPRGRSVFLSRPRDDKMDLNSILIWTVAMSCGVTIVHSFRTGFLVRGRFLVAVALGILIGIAYRLDRERAGFLAATAWSVLVLLPAVGSIAVIRMINKRRYRSAGILSRAIAIVHPFDGNWQQPRLIRALQLLQHERESEAEALLDALSRSDTAVGRTANVLLTRKNGNWQGLVEWIEAHSRKNRMLSDPMLADAYLQALGELGAHEDLAREYTRLTRRRLSIGGSSLLNLWRLKVCAFCGAVETVTWLTDGPLAELASDVKSYWRATSEQAAGQSALAERRFQELTRSTDRRVAHASLLRCLAPVPIAQPSTDVSTVLDGIARSVTHESRFAILGTQRRCPVRVVWGVAAILIAVFVLELPGGSSNPENLKDMGALVVPLSIVPGEWWRIFTAGFLHFGPLHLLLNLLGLIFFGHRLERSWGSRLMLVCYVSTMLGSIGLLTLIAAPDVAPTILVGASGGVMGLIGAILGQLGVGVCRQRSSLVTWEFNLLLLVVCVQLIFDAWTPVVSSECHLLGLACGVVIGIAVGVSRWSSAEALPNLKKPLAASCSATDDPP